LRNKKLIFILVCLLVLAVAAIGFIYRHIAIGHKPAPPQALTNQSSNIQTIQQGLYHPNITLVGHIEAMGLMQFKAPLAAKVSHVHIAEGDSIHKGQVLLELDKRKLQQELAYQLSYIDEVNAKITELIEIHQADVANLASEKELLQFQERTIVRMEQLNAKHLASDAELDAARAGKIRQQLDIRRRQLLIDNYKGGLAKLKTQLHRYELMVLQLKEDIANCQITAGYDGKIAKLMVASGDYVTAGQLMLTAYEINKLAVMAPIPDAQTAFLKKALSSKNPVQVEAMLDEQTIKLQLSRLGQKQAYFSLPQDISHFAPGQALTLCLSLPAVHAFSIPQHAIDKHNKVYIVKQGQTKAVQVKPVGKIYSLTQAEEEILIQSKFLHDGDRVIVSAPQALTTEES
jgi:multidrug efflux pump subunit AcrA (membrane-fusion protein)